MKSWKGFVVVFCFIVDCFLGLIDAVQSAS
jgi:hypothetical protein